jgi:hypothetical protein
MTNAVLLGIITLQGRGLSCNLAVHPGLFLASKPRSNTYDLLKYPYEEEAVPLHPLPSSFGGSTSF